MICCICHLYQFLYSLCFDLIGFVIVGCWSLRYLFLFLSANTLSYICIPVRRRARALSVHAKLWIKGKEAQPPSLWYRGLATSGEALALTRLLIFKLMLMLLLSYAIHLNISILFYWNLTASTTCEDLSIMIHPLPLSKISPFMLYILKALFQLSCSV